MPLVYEFAMGVVFSSVYTVWYDLAGCRTDYGCHLYVDRTTIVRTLACGAEEAPFASGLRLGGFLQSFCFA